ncbi:hypothetical protein G6F22_020331 [Rhizopus arrhizus]|nr:hypothetical protein G6F22_020331 [Rhizopus arrhizus]
MLIYRGLPGHHAQRIHQRRVQAAVRLPTRGQPADRLYRTTPGTDAVPAHQGPAVSHAGGAPPVRRGDGAVPERAAGQRSGGQPGREPRGPVAPVVQPQPGPIPAAARHRAVPTAVP